MGSRPSIETLVPPADDRSETSNPIRLAIRFDREPEPNAFDIPAGLGHAIEFLEHALLILLRDARAFVANHERKRFSSPAATNNNAAIRACFNALEIKFCTIVVMRLLSAQKHSLVGTMRISTPAQRAASAF